MLRSWQIPAIKTYKRRFHNCSHGKKASITVVFYSSEEVSFRWLVLDHHRRLLSDEDAAMLPISKCK